MTDPWAVLAGFAMVAFVFVLAPVAGSVYIRLRAPRWLRCPETRMPAAVAVDARHAAWTAAWSWPRLRIRSCTLWPQHAGCAQRCCQLPEVSDDEHLLATAPPVALRSGVGPPRSGRCRPTRNRRSL